MAGREDLRTGLARTTLQDYLRDLQEYERLQVQRRPGQTFHFCLVNQFSN